MNTLELNLRLTFSEDANITEKDKEAIIENVLDAMRRQIDNGMGIAPEDGEYITEMVDIRDENGHGLTFDLKEHQYL